MYKPDARYEETYDKQVNKPDQASVGAMQTIFGLTILWCLLNRGNMFLNYLIARTWFHFSR